MKISQTTSKILSVFIFLLTASSCTMSGLNLQPTLTPTVDSVVAEIESGKEQASEIIRAIDQYRQETGMYPNALEELVPKYLEFIPVTSTGQPFNYKLLPPYIYVLTFGLEKSQPGAIAYCVYLYKPNIWECGREHLP